MYYRKNRSILTSIRNNKNNKVYYILVVVMLAAICLIAASIILRGYNNSNGDNIAEETTLVADRTEQQGTSAAGDILDTIAGYKVYIFVDDGAIAYCTFNQDGELIDIAGAAGCNIGSGVSKYLNNMNRVVLKETMSASTKMLWKELTYNEEEYYVQYYSLINGIEFHSALYTENNNYNSIVKESEKQEETTEQKETTEAITEEPTEIVEHRTGDNIVGISDKDITTIYSTKYDTVRNDVTGNWKCIVIAENNFNVEDYALSCYKNYFDSDKTILAVENLTTKTSTSISVVSGLLYVSVYEYTKGEEHDAKAMFGGTHLVDYIVYTDNGDIEKVTDSE